MERVKVDAELMDSLYQAINNVPSLSGDPLAVTRALKAWMLREKERIYATHRVAGDLCDEEMELAGALFDVASSLED
jgi:hypothetical protein